MRVVVLMDALVTKGGAERVALALAKAFNADIRTGAYIPEEVYPEYRAFQIYLHPCKLSSLYAKLKPLRWKRLSYFWGGLMYLQDIHKFRRMNLSGYDLIISAGIATKHIAKRPENHPCIHYQWGIERYRPRWLVKALITYIKKLDQEAIGKVDQLVCDSENIRGKIASYYHLDAEIVYPPVDISRFYFGEAADYFLSVQRISPEKNIEIQLEAFRLLPEYKLLVVGSQSGTPYLRGLIRLAPQNVTFLGSLSDDEVSNLYSHAIAVIQTNPDEDFGIVPVEAMASGKPCIAVNAGGFKETIVHGRTGILVDPPYPENLAEAVRNFNSLDFDPNACMEQAKLFSEEVFIEKMRTIVSRL